MPPSHKCNINIAIGVTDTPLLESLHQNLKLCLKDQADGMGLVPQAKTACQSVNFDIVLGTQHNILIYNHCDVAFQ